MVHKMGLYSKPYSLTSSLDKTIELRLFDDKRRLIEIGDTLQFTDLDNESGLIVAEVVSIYLADTFKELYEFIPLEKCGYGVEEITNASYEDMYKYYEKEDILKYGVIGIEFKVLQEIILV